MNSLKMCNFCSYTINPCSKEYFYVCDNCKKTPHYYKCSSCKIQLEKPYFIKTFADYKN